MALLLDIRRLDPMKELNTSDSSANLTDYDADQQQHRLQHHHQQGQPVAFRNPTFQDDLEHGDKWSPPSPSVTILIHNNTDNLSPETTTTTNNNNDCRLDDRNKLPHDEPLTTSDSGIIICASNGPSANDDSSSIGGKSLDSGVYDAEGNCTGKVNPTGWKDSKKKKSEDKKDQESLCAICVQVFIPFLIAGTGTCGAGIVLDYVEDWKVFQKVTELFILVPTLLGLKGNLEMTLASRVSTQANLGKLKTGREIWQMSWGNMALIQCQATVMGFLAAAFATAMSVANGGFNVHHALLLSASALFTAAMASLVLGAITLLVVVCAHKVNINPDNVATPIAASLGDVTTLGLLSAISSYLYHLKDDLVPACIIVGVFLLLVPVWGYMSYKNPYVKQVLYSGWIPVILAVVITSAGGYILERSVSEFKGIAIFQPVINGVAGNLVAVQASRISTYFHKNAGGFGSRPPDGSSLCVSPCAAFFGRSTHARTARILMAMVIPGHLLFGYAITFIKGGDTVLTPNFLPIYLTSAFIQIALLLYLAHCMIQILWRLKIDPDNSAIPLITALGDLSGMVCLTTAFIIYTKLF